MTPEEHDRAAALASHIPHVAAAALVELLFAGHEAARELCASGFRDTTRVASGSPSLWESILEANRHEVAGGLNDLATLLQSVASSLDAGEMKNVRELLEAARFHRAELLGS
jgi:prephenate dehydrogenase